METRGDEGPGAHPACCLPVPAYLRRTARGGRAFLRLHG